jgi:hypothetical protein
MKQFEEGARVNIKSMPSWGVCIIDRLLPGGRYSVKRDDGSTWMLGLKAKDLVAEKGSAKKNS